MSLNIDHFQRDFHRQFARQDAIPFDGIPHRGHKHEEQSDTTEQHFDNQIQRFPSVRRINVDHIQQHDEHCERHDEVDALIRSQALQNVLASIDAFAQRCLVINVIFLWVQARRGVWIAFDAIGDEQFGINTLVVRIAELVIRYELGQRQCVVYHFCFSVLTASIQNVVDAFAFGQRFLRARRCICVVSAFICADFTVMQFMVSFLQMRCSQQNSVLATKSDQS